VKLGHSLEIEPAILSCIQGELVFPERIVVIALLPQSQAEIVVREESAGNRLRSSGTAGLRGSSTGGRRGSHRL
jgi:hypothetical protein